MSNYELIIQINPDDVKRIHTAKQNITIVKNRENMSKSSDLYVSWLSLDPYQAISVTWDKTYGIYASRTDYIAGAIIRSTATVDEAELGYTYPFESNIFQTGQPGKLNKYGVINKGEKDYIFGLLQQPSINGAKEPNNPMIAQTVLRGESADFTVIEKVFVFLYTQGKNGMIITDVTSDRLLVDFTEEASQFIHFDGTKFVPGKI